MSVADDGKLMKGLINNMKRKLLTLALIGTMALSISACGNNTTTSTTEQTTESSEQTAVDPTKETGEHDATEKDNTIADDAKEASSADKGSTDKLEGTYALDGSKNVTYTFADGKMTLTETGTYSMSSGKITMAYGNNDERTFDITETDDGFNLIADSNLLPLVYMEGTDGLTGSEPFDGVYQIEGAQGFIFSKDGKLSVVTTHECEVKDDSVTFAGQTYDYRTEGDSIILSTNGTDVMTLVPSK